MKQNKFKLENTYIGIIFFISFYISLVFLDIIIPGMFKDFLPVIILGGFSLLALGFITDLDTAYRWSKHKTKELNRK